MLDSVRMPEGKHRHGPFFLQILGQSSPAMSAVHGSMWKSLRTHKRYVHKRGHEVTKCHPTFGSVPVLGGYD